MAEPYDAYYYATGCGQPYERNEGWLRFFGGVADRIVADIGPTTVLDAGCALGFLVEMLRERGVQAFGVDISEFAIANVYPPIKPFCRVASLTDPLPQRYDLIVTIEVLEHVPPGAGEQIIANLCAHTDDILFSSTPFDYKEATHYNVQPPEYWAERFARHGFYRDVEFDAAFLTPWAARFRKTREPISRVIAAYERRWWQLQQENRARRELNLEQRNQLAAKEQDLHAFGAQGDRTQGQQARAEEKDQTIHALSIQIAEKDAAVATLDARLQDHELRWARLESSIGGRLLRALQQGRARLAPPGSARDRWLDRICRNEFRACPPSE